MNETSDWVGSYPKICFRVRMRWRQLFAYIFCNLPRRWSQHVMFYFYFWIIWWAPVGSCSFSWKNPRQVLYLKLKVVSHHNGTTNSIY